MPCLGKIQTPKNVLLGGSLQCYLVTFLRERKHVHYKIHHQRVTEKAFPFLERAFWFPLYIHEPQFYASLLEGYYSKRKLHFYQHQVGKIQCTHTPLVSYFYHGIRLYF